MALTTFFRDRQNSGTVAVAGNATTTLFTITIPTDRMFRLEARVLFGLVNSGHFGSGGSLVSDVVVKNNNGNLGITTGVASSFNPATEANLVATTANSMDAGILNSSTVTMTWVISGVNMQLQVTTGSAFNACDACAFVEIFGVGYA